MKLGSGHPLSTLSAIDGIARMDNIANLLCIAKTFTAADRLATAAINTLADVRHAPVLGSSVTLMQDGDNTGTAEPDGSAFTRIIGF